jgi:ketosteroid isomerase-like protein
MNEANKETAVRFIRAIGHGDIETIKSVVTPDMTIVTKGSCAISGTHDYAAIMMFATIFPQITTNGLDFHILTLTAEDDRVACEAEGYATLTSGDSYNNQYHFLLFFRDGKICQMREYMDTKLVDAALVPCLPQAGA